MKMRWRQEGGLVSRPGLDPLILHLRTKFLQSTNLPGSIRGGKIITPSPYPSLSICSLLLLLPCSPVFSMFRARPSPFRHFLPLTTTTSLPRAAMDPSPSNATKTVRVVVKGLVQGVFYRNWTVENATQLGLKGWVRNRRDGSVEALFSGSSDSVHEMEQRCRRGPPSAVVTAFQVFPSSDDPGSRFELKPTI